MNKRKKKTRAGIKENDGAVNENVETRIQDGSQEARKDCHRNPGRRVDKKKKEKIKEVIKAGKKVCVIKARLKKDHITKNNAVSGY